MLMKKNCLLHGGCLYLFIVFLLLPPLPSDGMEHQWSMGFGDSADQVCLSMAADHYGNTMVTGFFEGSVDFGGGPLTSAGGRDIFLAKFDRSGSHVWSKQFGDESDQTGFCVAVDGSGEIVLTGSFAGTVHFGGMPLTSAGGQDVFLARFDAAGSHLWSMAFGDAADQIGYSAAIDSSGNIFVTGDLSGPTDFGGGSLPCAGGRDIFLARFGADSNHHWSMCFGDGSDQTGSHVATDGSGNILITGWFEGAVNFGGGSLSNLGGKDMFLAKFDTVGKYLWAQCFGSKFDQAGNSIAADGADNVVVTGFFEGSVDFGGGFLASAGGRDMFLARFDAAGNHLWSQGFGDVLDQSGASVALNSAGDIVVTGYFEESVDFGSGPLTSSGLRDIFLSVFDPYGVNLLSWAFGDPAGQEGTCVTVADSGSILAAGRFAGTVNFGGGTITGAGGADLYLVSFGCPGDFDDDGDVDGADLAEFMNAFSSSELEGFAMEFGRVDCLP
jgi:hypothetical protein